MYKVLVVDDEPNIRRGLIHIIDWKHFGCVVCGEAVDGIDGLEKIAKLRPDIIIADINMPEMNGLQMITEAKNIVPRSKFIILTGYRDFSYLQEAIRVGAFDYILKPSKIENISAILKKAVLELKYQNENAQELERMKESFKKSIPLLKEKLLSDYILRRISLHNQNEELLELYNLNIKEFVLLVFSLDDVGKNLTPEQHYLYQFGVINTVDEILDDQYITEKVSLNPNQVAMVVQSTKPLDSNDLYKKIESIHELMKNCFDYCISVAISTQGFGVTELGSKMRECDKCLNYQFYLGKDSIILYEDLELFFHEQENIYEEAYDKEIIEKIKSGDSIQVTKSLEALGDYIKKSGPTLKIDQIKMYYSNLIYQINQIRVSVKELEAQESHIPKNMYSFYQMVESCSDIYELHGILKDMALSVVDKIESYNQNSINSTLQGAMDYIRENFAYPITLEDLAKHTYVSTYYLSRMFKKELGKNFVDFLNEQRIEKAKELLLNQDKKTYEVADEVGINDAHYFSKLFKKYVGMTPTEYKGSR